MEIQLFQLWPRSLLGDGWRQIATLQPTTASHKGTDAVTLEVRSYHKEDHGWIGSSGSKRCNI
jgi:hypothetical protein